MLSRRNRFSFLLTSAQVVGMVLGMASASSADLIINEIDYDQPSTDSAEFIEIKNPDGAPISLSGYSLQLVNGSGGGAVIYSTINLPAVNLASGDYFVVCANAANTVNCDLDVSPDTNLVQNGAPDAVALAFGGAVVDTVSYEGDTSGGYTEGSGSGLIDSSSTAFLGISRFPDGVDTDVNNVDLSPRCITPGEANQAADSGCGAPGPPTLVINEIDYDQAGTDAAEFVEIGNFGTQPVSLDGVEIQMFNGTGGGASLYRTVALPAVNLPAGGYFVVCGNAAQVSLCDLDVSPDTNLIQNGAPDAVALVSGGSILDTVSYEGDTGAPYTEGSGAGLVDVSSVDLASISRFPDLTDSNQNNVDLSLRCATPGLPNSSATSDCANAGPPNLVINEVDYDQPSTDAAEFVEIYNPGASAVDLLGVELVFANGSTGSEYRSFALPDVQLAAGDFYVVCANAANTPDCDLDVSPDTNLIQNGSPDAVALAFGSLILDAVSYEGVTAAPYAEGGGAPADPSGDQNVGLSRLPDGSDSDDNSSDFTIQCVTPGQANSTDDSNCFLGPPLEVEIWEIQGPGLVSPIANAPVITEQNVVTAVGFDGFFMQTPVARTDGDANTSDGIFVFTGGAPGVSVGDLVDVSAVVQEFFGFTELSGVSSVVVTGTGALPAAVALNPSPNQPQPDNELERFEGMLVTFDGVATAPSDRFGDVDVVAGPNRAFREPGIEYPGLAGLPVWDGNPEIFEFDPDGLTLADVDVFGGQVIEAKGVLGFSFGDYQVWPTSYVLGTPPTLPRPVRMRAWGELTVATQNMQRLFDDMDDPLVDDQVVDPLEYQGRLGKISNWVRNVLDAPDVLVVQEVESLSVLDDLTARIASDDATLVYTAWLLEGNDVGGIDVGFLTRNDRIVVNNVEQFGENTIFFFDGSLLNDRPPLLLDATYIGDGAPLDITVIGVHQRSLSGIEGSSATRVRLKRFEQARELSEFVQQLQTDDPARRIVVAGDFNAFEFTDGYVDVLGQITGNLDPLGDEAATFDAVNPDLRNEVLSVPATDRYSFNFAGSSQAIDHILTSVSIHPRVIETQFARGNVDAPVNLLLDFGSDLRIADHDGLVLFVQSFLDDDGDGVENREDLCADTMIPESVPTQLLKPNHYALVDGDTTFDTEVRGSGTPLTYTTEDTGGCSCEQIIEALGLGSGHSKFGCSDEVMAAWVQQISP